MQFAMDVSKLHSFRYSEEKDTGHFVMRIIYIKTQFFPFWTVPKVESKQVFLISIGSDSHNFSMDAIITN